MSTLISQAAADVLLADKTLVLEIMRARDAANAAVERKREVVDVMRRRDMRGTT